MNQYKKGCEFVVISLLLLSLINLSKSDGLCSYNDISFLTSGCRNNRTNIYFSYKNTCTEIEPIIPLSKLNTPCHECKPGEYMSYDFEKKEISCAKCKSGTYSTGNSFLIRSQYREWANTNIFNKLINYCYISDSFKEEDTESCIPFTVSNSGEYIQSNSGLNTNNYDYTAVLGLNAELVTEGSITFKYMKTNENNNLSNGQLKLYINYVIQYDDYNETFTNGEEEYKEIVINLSPGNYSFLWEFAKSVHDQSQEAIGIKIKDIIINGISSNPVCTPCPSKVSSIGSDHCDFCNEGQYYDSSRNICKECPEGKISGFNAIGEENCVVAPACKEDNYYKKYSPFCEIATNKTLVSYSLIDKKVCTETGNSKNNEFMDQCQPCLPGQFVSRINNTHYKCEYCPENQYSENINDNHCKQCPGAIQRKFYTVPTEPTSYKANINILSSEGELSFSYRLIKKNKISEVTLQIDNDKIQIPINNEKEESNYTTTIGKGQHNISISCSNIYLLKVAIFNSSLGGGYTCDECKLGFISKENGFNVCKDCGRGSMVISDGKCVACNEGQYKYSSHKGENCKKCPEFTYSNPQRTNCVPYDILENTQKLKKFKLEDFEKYQNLVCKATNNLCYKSFYGPIREKGESTLYYISYNESNNFNSPDFSYENKNQGREWNSDTKEEESFVFMLIGNNTKGDNNNIKKKVSLGREIEYIKIIDKKNDKGILIKYNNGDSYKENPQLHYNSFLFLRCTFSYNNFNNIFSSPKLESIDNNNYYFIWNSFAACPICLKSQVNETKLVCKNYTRSVYYTPNDLCSIQNTTFEENVNGKSKYSTRSDTSIMDKEIDKVFSVYHISNIESSSNNLNEEEEDYYIENTKTQEACYLYEDYDGKSIIIIILIPIIYIIIVVLFIIICCKYRKFRGSYQKLQEEIDGGKANYNENNKIEISGGKEGNTGNIPDSEPQEVKIDG